MTSYQIHATEYNRAAAIPASRPGETAGTLAGMPHPAAANPVEPFGESLAWREQAHVLADWAIANVIVRIDCYVAYRRIPTANVTLVEPRTIRDHLSRDLLVRHFRGDSHEERLAVHIVCPITGRCKATIIDIDAHDPDDDPDANWAFAREVERRAMGRCVETIVFDSNGAGGYHVWALHRQPIPCAESYRFGKWLIDGWSRHGLRTEPESFPKSPGLTGKGFGQTIRLPGRHPRRPHFTAVWDGVTDDRIAGFRRGAAAVQAILETRGRLDRDPLSPLVPPDFVLPTEMYYPAFQGRDLDPDDLDREAARAREALTYLGAGYYEDYEKWLRVGMGLRRLGDQGLAVWHEWSARSRRKYQPRVLDEKWQSFEVPAELPPPWSGRRRSAVGLGTIIAWAKAEGWQPPGSTQESMAEKADRFRQALLECPEELAELASRLEVTEDVLHRLGVGWTDENFRPVKDGSWVDDGRAWAFPVLSGSGEIIGILRKYLDETVDDRMVQGSKPGLLVPAGWEKSHGPILVTESADDVAWLVGAGYSAIGRPAFTGGVEHLARLLEGVDRKIVVLAEDDRTIDGQWPGKERAEAVAQGLATSLGRGVKRWLPPEGCEGVCEYIKLRRNGSLEE